MGGRAHEDAAPARPRRGAAARHPDQHRRARAEGRRGRARARRRPLHHARAARVRHRSSTGSPTCSGARSATTTRTRTPTACARPAARAGRSPTTAPTSSGRRSRTCRAARSGRRSSSATPAEERHFAVHSAHCVGLNEADEAAWARGRPPDARRGDGQRHARPGARAARRARRARRDRGRLPAGRARHSAASSRCSWRPRARRWRHDARADTAVRGRPLLRVPALARRPLVGRRLLPLRGVHLRRRRQRGARARGRGPAVRPGVAARTATCSSSR